MLQRKILISAFSMGCCLCALGAAVQTHESGPAAAVAQEACNPRQFVQMKKELQDWPDLARYRKADAALAPPTPGEQRVVFLGDSITDIWGRMKGTGPFFPGEPYVNRGISGQTTPQMLVRFQQDVVELHPAVVLILAGINDIAGNTGPEPLTDIENNFRSMVEIAKANHIRVVLASVLPASRLPWRPTVEPAEEVRTLNAWIQQYAGEQHVVFCNYYPALVNSDGGMREELAVDK